jgi:hypothetical protein
VERYEELRERVLRGATAGCRLGLALLLREGMAGWMEAWGRCADPSPRTPSPAASTPAHDGVRSELVHVLAAMALGGLGRAGA